MANPHAPLPVPPPGMYTSPTGSGQRPIFSKSLSPSRSKVGSFPPGSLSSLPRNYFPNAPGFDPHGSLRPEYSEEVWKTKAGESVTSPPRCEDLPPPRGISGSGGGGMSSIMSRLSPTSGLFGSQPSSGPSPEVGSTRVPALYGSQPPPVSSTSRLSDRRPRNEIRLQDIPPVRPSRAVSSPSPPRFSSPMHMSPKSDNDADGVFSPSARVSRRVTGGGEGVWRRVLAHSLIAFACGFAHIVSVLEAVGSIASITTHIYGVGKALSQESIEVVIPFLYPIIAYAGGGALAEVLVGDMQKVVVARHGLLLLISAACFAGGVPLLEMTNDRVLVVTLWTLGSGLLNGAGTIYDHLRLTHYTGATTDLGCSLGRVLCRRGGGRAYMLLPPWLTFLVGTYCGTVAWHAVGVAAMFIPAGELAVLGLCVGTVRWWQSRKRHATSPPPLKPDKPKLD
eukprot:Hpha_TRINITY_DN601_c0_g1::TRINITY_DN601_c0_g1_i1::g.21254::m.21254